MDDKENGRRQQYRFDIPHIMVDATRATFYKTLTLRMSPRSTFDVHRVPAFQTLHSVNVGVEKLIVGADEIGDNASGTVESKWFTVNGI